MTGSDGVDLPVTDTAQGPAEDPVARLRKALRDGDARTVTALLASVPVGILVTEGRPLVVREADDRVLTVFLSSDSVDAFGSDGEVRLLRARELYAVLTALQVDGVLFDPALTSAISVPAREVRSMVQGEYVDADGRRQLTGEVTFEPDPVGRDAVRAALDAEVLGTKVLGIVGEHAWMTTRTSRGIDVPALALAFDVRPDDIEALVAALCSADLPGSLEVTQLDEERTRTARSQWNRARLAAGTAAEE